MKIRELSFKETKDLYEVRESLECRAAGLGAIHVTEEILRKMEECLVEQHQVVKTLDDVAYSKSDDKFHVLVCDASRNGLLKEIVCQVRSKALPLAFRITRNLEDFYNFTFRFSRRSGGGIRSPPRMRCTGISGRWRS